VCVCVCVSHVKGKRLELSGPNLVDIQCMVAVAQHALSREVKSQGRVVIRCAAGGGVHVDRTAWVFTQ